MAPRPRPGRRAASIEAYTPPGRLTPAVGVSCKSAIRPAPSERLPPMTHTDARDMPIAPFVAELDRLAADVMADWKVPGVALAVVKDGNVALRAYGQRDVEADLPVTPATQFLICSITK